MKYILHDFYYNKNNTDYMFGQKHYFNKCN